MAWREEDDDVPNKGIQGSGSDGGWLTKEEEVAR